MPTTTTDVYDDTPCDDSTSIVPVLLATGYSDAAVDVRGDFPILRKPYEIHQLSRAIATLRR